MKQKVALETLKMGHNIFLTGPAGSGKTFLLNQYIKFLKNKGISLAVTASTGIAATHMNGQTIHAWSGMGIKENIPMEELLKMKEKFYLRKKIVKARVLIIDEISMLHPHQIDNVDRICRVFKNPLQPFGGMQVIFCGDFFQLPPVSNGGPAKFACESEIWQQMDLKICYLEEQHRQNECEILKVLGDIRQRNISEETLEIIMSRHDKQIKGLEKPTKLFTHNADVDAINNLELAKLKEKEHIFEMTSKGDDYCNETLKKGCMAPERLVLKRGALVMFVKNNFEAGYVNGTQGTVVDFDSYGMPVVRLFSGEEIIVETQSWEITEDEKVKARIRQIPLRLAWAITIHKSQGMSLDAAEIDLRKSFVHGMGYVALSRVRSIDGLKLLGLNRIALEVSEKAYLLDCALQKDSKAVEALIKKMDVVKKSKKQLDFLKKISQ